MRAIVRLAGLCAIAGLTGCLVMTGPSLAPLERNSSPGLIRLGDVKVRFTGTWAEHMEPDSFTSTLNYALRDAELADMYTGDPEGLILDVELVVDHQADEPRLVALGLLSMATIGAVPMYYYSEWNAQGDVRIRTGDGREVGRYALVETGTYRVIALPPTMFTLLGAGIRGDSDGKNMTKKVSRNIARKIYAKVSADRTRLAKLKEQNVPTLDALGGGARALLERGRLYLESGRRSEALADIRKYAELEPRLLGALDEADLLAFYDTERRRDQTLQAAAGARAAERTGDLAEAFRQYGRAYALAPDEGGQIERFASALRDLYPQLTEKPRLPESARRFFIEGEEHARAERYEAAVAAFSRVAQVAPWYPQAHFNRALVLERLERYEDAAASMRAFLALAPSSPQARTARDRLYQWQGHASPAAPSPGFR